MEEPTSKIIPAAGGLVINERNEVLFIYRRNKWDLPKGKIEPGEQTEKAALREVFEETGIQQVELKEFLLTTHHRYAENGLSILKETHWYRMEAGSNQILIPQLEEEITELKWIGESGFKEVKQNTFPTILEVLEAAGYRMD